MHAHVEDILDGIEFKVVGVLVIRVVQRVVEGERIFLEFFRAKEPDEQPVLVPPVDPEVTKDVIFLRYVLSLK